MSRTGSQNTPFVHRPMRIAFFAGSMRPGHDGVTRVLYRTIDAMNQRGVESLFFSPIVPEGAERSVPMRRVASVPFPLYKDYRLALPALGPFDRDIGRFRPDLLHIHSPCSLGLAAVQYGRRWGIPVVATYHTHFVSYAKYYGVTLLETPGWNYLRCLYNRCQRVFVPSQPILDILCRHGIEHLVYLPHGVDTEAFHPRFRDDSWRRSRSPEGKQILFFAGRLVWEKDLQTLIEVYRLLESERNDWILVLAGDGPIRGTLEAAMPRALFLGNLHGSELSVAYASSDVFVFPSTSETFGNVTLEAMASGVVPICVREGGASALIRDGETGFVTRPRNPSEIVSRIRELLDSPGRRAGMAQRARKFALMCRWERIFGRLFHAYDQVVNGTLRPGLEGGKKVA